LYFRPALALERLIVQKPFFMKKFSLSVKIAASFFLIQFFVSCKKNGGSNPAITNSGPKVTTFAGGGPSVSVGPGGNVDGDDTSARFNYPTSITFDRQGNMYVSDEYNYSIREISGGKVSTLIPNSPIFNGPDGVAVDSKGNIDVSDNISNRIWGITGGSVGILIGGGAPGYQNGKGYALFNVPSALAIDAQDNIYLAEQNDIRKITPDTTASTFAGGSIPFNTGDYKDGPDTTARFKNPTAIAFDAQGNLYVADAGNFRIRKITPAGLVSTVAGSGQSGFKDGPAATAQFTKPNGIAVDKQGNIYVSDFSCIRKITPDGMVSTFAGTQTVGFADGPAATAQFWYPGGLAFDSNGNLYVADSGNYRIRKITFN
jgi:sugar lactone lactonase YvrE